MEFRDQLEYLKNLGRFGIEPGLERVALVLQELGDPQKKFPAIHITGTNGKGSTAVMIEAALRAAGNKTGLYTSPHIYRFNERVKISGQEISDTDLSRLISRVKNAAEKVGVHLTFFEFTTVVAFLHFAEQQVEIAVVEVGMGGLYDATNVVRSIVSAVTNVSLDHTDFLGKTTMEIAKEKAGIIKPGAPIVLGKVESEISNYVKKVAAELGSEFIDASTRQAEGCPLPGTHQQQNAAVALSVLEVSGLEFDLAGWQSLQWEGRLDVVQEYPTVLVDGAHNEAAFQALHQHITSPETKLSSYDVLVVGLKKNKESKVLVEKIAPLFKKIITTEGAYLPMPAGELAGLLNGEVVAQPELAIKKALQIAGPDGSVLVTGSLYMIPKILAELRHKKQPGLLSP